MELEEKFEELLDEFDFFLVEKVMALMDWKWSFAEGLAQPRIYQMKKHCRQLFNAIYEKFNDSKNTDYTNSSGGFQVTIDKFGNIILEFVVIQREYNVESNTVF